MMAFKQNDSDGFILYGNDGLFLHLGGRLGHRVEDAVSQLQHVDAVVDGDSGRRVVDDGAVEALQLRLDESQDVRR